MKHLFTTPLLIIVFCISLYAQKQVIDVPDYWETSREGTLNDSVNAAIQRGTLSNTVFKLKLNGTYIITGSIVTPAGQTLEIIADDPGTTQETSPPQILWKVVPPSVWPDYISDTTRNYFFNCYGDLILKNIWVLYADTQGQHIGSCIIFQDDSSSAARRCNFEGVIIDYASIGSKGDGSVTVACKKFRGTFKNCYWKNCTDPHFRYYGRALSFPYSSTGFYGDTLIFENCTFANIGYVLMQEGGEYYNYVKFNHCTFLNVVMYSLESGWWNKLSVTNCIFVNCYMFGDIPAMSFYSSEVADGGTLRIDSLSHSYYGTTYSFPFAEQDRRILFTNSSYYIEKWLRDWMYNNPASVDWRRAGMAGEIPMPQPMLNPGTLSFFDSTDSQGNKVFPYMNRANLYDSANPGFHIPPTDTEKITVWLYHKWYDSWDGSWAWKPENSINQIWPLEENLTYTNNVLKTAGMSGFPLGDLYHWWPVEYQQWKAQEAAENDTINKRLHYGFNSAVSVNEHPGIPDKYILEQNYPNPFNPTTTIKFTIPTSPFSQKGDRGGFITLKVCNLLGQEVAKLFEGIRQPGSYEITFDGSILASGVYFYKLQTTEFTSIKKMLLLK